jgi:hypothetical protein
MVGSLVSSRVSFKETRLEQWPPAQLLVENKSAKVREMRPPCKGLAGFNSGSWRYDKAFSSAPLSTPSIKNAALEFH